MRIVYYLPSLSASGGIERIVTFKANYFAEHFANYEIFIITSEQMGDEPYFPLSPKVKHIDIDVPIDRPYSQSLITKMICYPYRYFLFKKRFTKVLNTIHADITISTMRRELSFINSLKDGSVKIGEFHVTRYAYGGETLHNQFYLIKLLKKYLVNKFISNVSNLKKVVLLTSEDAKKWPELNNSIVIPNPIANDLKPIMSDCMKRNAIAVGRYVPQKGFDMLILAWQLVIDKHPDWTLNIYGEGHLEDSYLKQIEKMNLKNNCFLKNPVKNIFQKYSESSILVLSSRYEGFGMVITEAMSCGLPVVSFSCPCGPKDIIGDGKDGFLVEPNNISQLAEKINYLIENVDERVDMGHHALISSERYKMENISKIWHDLFEKLVK